MDIQHYARVAWQWKWLLVAATLLGAAGSYWVTISTPPIYISTTTLSVGQFLQSDKVSGSEFTTTQQLAQAYALTARRQDILESVIRTLQLPTTASRLASQVSAAAVPQTQLMRISVADVDPRRAQAITNAVAEAVIRESPTGDQTLQDQEQRRFITQQVNILRGRIEDAESQIREIEEKVARENSARAIQDLQSQAATLQARITVMQGNYSRLLELARGSRLNFLTIVEPASVGVSSAPPVLVNVLAASLAGFLLAALTAVGLDFFDDRIKSADDTEKALHLPTLGVIAHGKRAKKPHENLYIVHQPGSWIGETFRLLRSGLQYVSATGTELPKSIVITSPNPGEGKTTVACNLALSLAQAGRNVVLCDADMRLPAVHRYFDVPNGVGLSTLLTNPALPIADALQVGPVPSLTLLTAGPLPDHPGDLLGAATFADRIRELEARSDIVIVDTAAVLAVADAASVVSFVESTVLVIRLGKTRAFDARRAQRILEQGRPRLSGVVLNDSRERRNTAFEYYRSATSPRRHVAPTERDEPESGARG